MSTTKPIITFVNDTEMEKKIAIATYAFSFDYPQALVAIKPKYEIRIAVNSKEEIPQYVWHIPPTKGVASFVIDPTQKKIYV